MGWFDFIDYPKNEEKLEKFFSKFNDKIKSKSIIDAYEFILIFSSKNYLDRFIDEFKNKVSDNYLFSLKKRIINYQNHLDFCYNLLEISDFAPYIHFRAGGYPKEMQDKIYSLSKKASDMDYLYAKFNLIMDYLSYMYFLEEKDPVEKFYVLGHNVLTIDQSIVMVDDIIENYEKYYNKYKDFLHTRIAQSLEFIKHHRFGKDPFNNDDITLYQEFAFGLDIKCLDYSPIWRIHSEDEVKLLNIANLRKAKLKLIKYKYPNYESYLNSDLWHSIRNEALILTNGKCKFCGKQATQVHHRQYPEIWGEEKISDLVPICNHCHEVIHNLK